jgi:hypothetical protein
MEIEPNPGIPYAFDRRDFEVIDPLSLADRCDAGPCGAQAFIRASFMEGDLFFCQHHYTKYYTAINAQAIWVHEQLEGLLVAR